MGKAGTRIQNTIRLYRAHDLDLITFIKAHKLDLHRAMYCALKSLANDEHFVINIPPLREGWEQTEFKKVYTYMFYLDPELDQDVLEMLGKVEDGYRNNFMKNILRLYLCNPMSEFFLKHKEDDKYFYDKFKVFRKDRREADAGNMAKEIKDAGLDKKEQKDGAIVEKEIRIQKGPEIPKEQASIQQNEKSEPDVMEEIIDKVQPVKESTTDYQEESDDEILDMFLSIAD